MPKRARYGAASRRYPGQSCRATGILVDDMVDTADNDRLCGRPTAPIDFVGFSIGDVFAVGYGTDYAKKIAICPISGPRTRSNSSRLRIEEPPRRLFARHLRQSIVFHRTTAFPILSRP
jgi:hypothetical protein